MKQVTLMYFCEICGRIKSYNRDSNDKVLPVCELIGESQNRLLYLRKDVCGKCEEQILKE